jgi:CBS domain-containing protein
VVSDLASPPRFVDPDATLPEAIAHARREGLAQLPVCEDGRIVGLFSVEGAVRLQVGEEPDGQP